MLDQADIDRLAEALAPRLAAQLQQDDDGWVFPTRGLVDVDDVCRLLRIEREWVYAHKLELGAVRIGEGERGPLRFDAAKVLAYVESHRLKRSAEKQQRRPGRPRKQREREFDVLEIPEAVR